MYIHTNISVIYEYINTCSYVHIYTCMCIFIHIYIYVHLYILFFIFWCTYIRICIHVMSYMNEWFHTFEWDTWCRCKRWRNACMHMNSYECDMSYINKSCHTNTSHDIYEWVISHICMSHVVQVQTLKQCVYSYVHTNTQTPPHTHTLTHSHTHTHSHSHTLTHTHTHKLKASGVYSQTNGVSIRGSINGAALMQYANTDYTLNTYTHTYTYKQIHTHIYTYILTPLKESTRGLN